MAPKEVLFLNTPTPGFRKFTRNFDCASESKGNYYLQPFDFINLSGLFPKETNITFIDCVAEELSLDAALSVQYKNYDLIITGLIDSLWDQDLQSLKKLRETFPETVIFVFGDSFLEKNNVKQVLAWADGVLADPYSLNISIVENWRRDEVRKNYHQLGLVDENLDKSPNKTFRLIQTNGPRHELFNHASYRWPFSTFKRYSTVTTSWGCPYSCSYCTASNLSVFYKDYQEIIKELISIKSLGIKEIYFSDKSFGLPLNNTIHLLNQMIEQNLQLSWSTYFHPNQFTPDLLKLMKNAGCHTIIIGIESARFENLKSLGRKINPEKIWALLDMANKLKMNVCGDFIIGLPNESKQDVLETLTLSTSLKLDYASFNIATPLPNTSIKKEALLDGRLSSHQHHYDTTGFSQVLPSKLINAEDLVLLRKKAVVDFYLRPKYLLRRILRLRGLEHFLIQFEEIIQILKKIFLKAES